jgi:peptidoglycan/xylan/chitin deacetylase (PgdA/CDA1 family)
VILTFDAGSERGYAQRILDVLQAAGVRASFGITGQWAEQNPDLVRRMSDEGHTLINHSYDHASFTGASWDHTALTFGERADQLHRAEAAIAAAAPGATTVPYFRPPFGDYNAGVLADAGALGYRYALMWAVDSGGWRGLSSAEVLLRVSAAQAGDIIIMHVGSQGDADALPAIIDQLRARGLGFAAVADAFP